MARANDQAFLDDILAGLDSAVFDAPMLSSSPVPSSQPQPSKASSQTRRPLSQRNGPASQLPKRDMKHVKIEIEGKENRATSSTNTVKLQQQHQQPLAPRTSPPPRKKPKLEDSHLSKATVGASRAVAITQPSETSTLPQCKQFTRCLVESVHSEYVASKRQNQKVLQVSLPKTQGIYKVILEDDWQQCEIEMGNVVNVIGSFDRTCSPAAVISRSEGFLIVHPDILVSATKVADSSHCARKAVLQEIIRSSHATTPSLLYGNLLHELMQHCMLQDRWDDEFRREQITELLEKELQTLWSIDLNVGSALDEMIERSNTFLNFNETFAAKTGKGAVLSDPRSVNGKEEKVAIRETIDIEEDVWCPRYGLKGKIDVTVNASVHAGHSFAVEDLKTHPFEIKTGKSAAAMEHRAQTMLYTLLVTDRYDGVIDTGLLYYTRTNEVFKVPASRNELRGLIIARNEFATYLHRRMTLSVDATSSRKPEAQQTERDEFDMFSSPVQTGRRPALLPAPIDEERSCTRCYVGEACMLYRKAIDGPEQLPLEAGSELEALFEQRTSSLTDKDTDFFKHWERLISLEEQELVRHRKEVWTMSAEERMALGRCIANLQVDDSHEQGVTAIKGSKMHRFTYRLKVKHASQWTSTQAATNSLHGGNISVGDPVVVSLEEPAVLAISRGFVLEVSHESVLVGLDHSLLDLPQLRDPRYASIDRIYRLDKDELAAGMGRIRDNLIQLFTEAGDEKRRRLIVHLDMPRFEEHRLITFDDSKSSVLNSDQVSAIDQVCRAQDYALILGMPGTGKTSTIAELIRVLVANGKSVLLASYTHSAVDNILLKLDRPDGPSILRLGNRDKIMPSLHKFTLERLDSALSMHQLDRLLMEPSVVATTCLSINEPIFSRRRFDYCIIDEASQVTLPACIGPLRFADKFVLVGDHKQLPPLVRNNDAKAGGLETSLFKMLSEAHPTATVNLSFQYRMSEDIMHLSNTLVYDKMLKAGDALIASRKLVLPHHDRLDTFCQASTCTASPCWLRDVLAEDRRVIFVNTDKCPAPERKQGSLIDNATEANLCAQMTSALVTCGVREQDIGIITLYRQQIRTIKRRIAFADVEVLTADQSQGRDKDCIIMSLVRSNDQQQSGDLLKDWRRINVCLTRAKSKLVIFGSRSTLSKVLEPLFKVVDEKGWTYDLPADAHKLHKTAL